MVKDIKKTEYKTEKESEVLQTTTKGVLIMYLGITIKHFKKSPLQKYKGLCYSNLVLIIFSLRLSDFAVKELYQITNMGMLLFSGRRWRRWISVLVSSFAFSIS